MAKKVASRGGPGRAPAPGVVMERDTMVQVTPLLVLALPLTSSLVLPESPSLSGLWLPSVPNEKVGVIISTVPSNSRIRFIGLNTLTHNCLS